MNLNRLMTIAALAAFFAAEAEVLPAKQIVSPTFVDSQSGDGDSFLTSLDKDGRFVVFVSNAKNLASNDRNDRYDLFVRDLEAGETRLISANPVSGSSGDGESALGLISPDGRYIAFESSAEDLAPNDGNGFQDVFLHDRATSETRLISRESSGLSAANDASHLVQITKNGRYVVFESDADNITPNDANDALDIFRYDIALGVIETVSVNVSGTGTQSGASLSASSSADGRYIAFVSAASDVTSEVVNGRARQLYMRDMEAGKTALATRSFQTGEGVSYVVFRSEEWLPRIEWMGGRLLFESISQELIDFENPIPQLPSYFSYDVKGSGLHRLALDSKFRTTAPPIISDNERFIAFTTYSSPSFFTPSPDFEVYDMETQEIVFDSLDFLGVEDYEALKIAVPIAISDDGSVFYFLSPSNLNVDSGNSELNPLNLYRLNKASKEAALLSSTRTGEPASLSILGGMAARQSGRVFFHTAAPGLVDADRNQSVDVFMLDESTGSISLVSKAAQAAQLAAHPGPSAMGDPRGAAGGSSLVYAARRQSDDGDDARAITDIFLHDLASEETKLVSVDSEGLGSANGYCHSPVISQDGNRVGFVSWATNLVSEAHAGGSHVFIRDLETERTRILSLGLPLSFSDRADQLTLSADGRQAAFSAGGKIYFFDETLDSVLDVSLRFDGEPMTESLYYPVISPDGSFIVFQSDRPRELVEGLEVLNWYYFIARDIETGINTILFPEAETPGNIALAHKDFLIQKQGEFAVLPKIAAGAAPELHLVPLEADISPALICQNCGEPSIAGDSGLIAYVDYSGDNDDVWVYDIQTETRTLASGPVEGEAAATADSWNPSISGDGRWVIFQSRATNLTPETDLNQAADIFLHDRNTGTTIRLTPGSLSESPPFSSASSQPIAVDGRGFAFTSNNPLLASQDQNRARDIFIVYLSTRDIDRDGLDDLWEQTYFESLIEDGDSDWDSDGMSNRQEYHAGTDPTDLNSAFTIISIVSLESNQTRIIWQSVKGRNYNVESINDLSTGEWKTVVFGIESQDRTTSVILNRSSERHLEFYRVVTKR